MDLERFSLYKEFLVWYTETLLLVSPLNLGKKTKFAAYYI
jgi:hypothetical protein